MLARQSLLISATVSLLLIISAQPQSAPQAADPFSRGEGLFFGKLPLQGKPRDHVDYFPAPVVRCVNCHGDGQLKLDSALLMEPHQRRQGPPSMYDQARFCKLLHTGIDPAYIMIDHAMPIYTMTDGDCAALWTYITQKESPHARP